MSGNAYRQRDTAHYENGAFGFDAAVYCLEPAHMHLGGVTSHVIVMATPNGMITDIYPCHEDGLIAEWEPLDASFVGGVNHAAALRSLGYEVVAHERA